MGGFGRGPFGEQPFGEWHWSRDVLHDHAPELYRHADMEQGFLFEKLSGSFSYSFDNLLRKTRDWSSLRLSSDVRTQYNGVEKLTLGPRVVPHGEVTQRGVDGVIAAGGFNAKSARFQPSDAGKELEIYGSQQNRELVTVARVLSSSAILTFPPLKADPGRFRWELREPGETSADSVEIEVQYGSAANVSPGWLVFDGYAEFTVLGRRQLDSKTEREGEDGTIELGVRGPVLHTPTGRFSYRDIGRRISVSKSEVPTNNIVYEIVEVLDAANALISGDPVEDNGPLFWAVLPRPVLRLANTARTLRGAVEQYAAEPITVSGTTVTLPSGKFAQTDIGKRLTFRGSANNATSRDVVAVISATKVTLNTALPASDYTVWELRATNKITNPTITQRALVRVPEERVVVVDANARSVFLPHATLTAADVGRKIRFSESKTQYPMTCQIVSVADAAHATLDALPTLNGEGECDFQVWELYIPSHEVCVEARAPSMIALLAKDFGVEIDREDTEEDQRGWVGSLPQWIDTKGADVCYRTLAAISRFEADVRPLYYVSQTMAEQLGAPFTVADTDAGSAGTDGTLELRDDGTYLIAPSARFTASVVGRLIRVRGSTTGNDRTYSVVLRVDDHSVKVEGSGEVTLPDRKNGALEWMLVRSYTDKPPRKADPLDVSADFEAMATGFDLSKYAWEEGYASEATVALQSATAIEPNRFRIRLQMVAQPVLRTGNWRLRIASTDYWLETIPKLVGVNQYETEVIAETAPPVGIAKLVYDVPYNPEPDYCGASRLAILLDDASGATLRSPETGIDRLVTRLLSAVPAHISPLTVFSRTLNAYINIVADIEWGKELGPVQYAPVTAYYDDFAADLMTTDTVGILATITTSEQFNGAVSRTFSTFTVADLMTVIEHAALTTGSTFAMPTQSFLAVEQRAQTTGSVFGGWDRSTTSMSVKLTTQFTLSATQTQDRTEHAVLASVSIFIAPEVRSEARVLTIRSAFDTLASEATRSSFDVPGDEGTPSQIVATDTLVFTESANEQVIVNLSAADNRVFTESANEQVSVELPSIDIVLPA